jgi:hypothetical protein
VDWDTTAKTASFTAVSGNGYFVNTTSGGITVTLPAGSAGDIVSLADYAATWQTNNVTVSPNGTDKIGSQNENATLSTQGQSVTFVYVDSTQGWINTMDSTSNVRGLPPFIVATGGTITTCGNCKIHTFTGPGTFTVCNVAGVCGPTRNVVSYMVVAGGGGGAGSDGGYTVGGAGGAGGFREDKSPVTPYTASPLDGAGAITVTATSFPITVGSGGTAGSSYGNGSAGSNSVFSTITSTGGGGGASFATPPGGPGGSGGGGGGYSHPNNPYTGGTGNTPPVSPSQGNPGGNGQGPNNSTVSSGGGGGAAAAGGNASSGQGGTGGNGVATSITGSSVTRAGGGGGSGYPSPGAAGSGGGGAGTPMGNGQTACSGTINTGGGGGGTATPQFGPGNTGGTGGSGIVVIRYKYQ